MVLDRLEAPIVLAPMAGGPSTPDLAAAVSAAGGLGFLATGYLTAAAASEQIARLRELTGRPFGVNVFVPSRPTDPAEYAAFVARLGDVAERAGVPLGEPRFDDDDWDAKIAALVAAPPAVVSFTFGCPPGEAIARLRAVGSEVWVTVTTPDEAVQAIAAGADALVVQGGEAGGHRASFVDRLDVEIFGLLALLQLVRAAVDVPLVATGGIATGRAVAATLCAGAAAAQVGTAFMRCPEAGTAQVLRDALTEATPTGLTRAFTGRLARGIENSMMTAHRDAPIAYPELHHVTAPVRRAAREASDPELVNLWAGETHQLARERPAAEIVRELADEAHRAIADASASLDRRLGEAG
jgi:nitronate monooxygenase